MLGLKTYLIVAVALIALIASCSIVRNCKKFWEPKKPPRSWSFGVAGVSTGASIEVKTGLRDRRTATITLADIAAPSLGEPFCEESRANLERLAGTRIRVETERHGLFSSDAQASQRRLEEEPPATAEAPEARAPAVGVAYGEYGDCLNVAQVAEGMARCNPGADKSWLKMEAAAKKAKLGLWSKEK